MRCKSPMATGERYVQLLVNVILSLLIDVRLQSSMAIPPLKSILKPTVPLSPPRQIPAFDQARKRNSSRSPSPRKSRETPKSPQAEEGMLIDFSTPAGAPVTGTEQLDNPFDGFNASSAIRDAKEREEKERRERERKAILEQREARRKSMGELYFFYIGKHPTDDQKPTAESHLLRRQHFTHGTLSSWAKIRPRLLQQTQRGVRHHWRIPPAKRLRILLKSQQNTPPRKIRMLHFLQ